MGIGIAYRVGVHSRQSYGRNGPEDWALGLTAARGLEGSRPVDGLWITGVDSSVGKCHPSPDQCVDSALNLSASAHLRLKDPSRTAGGVRTFGLHRSAPLHVSLVGLLDLAGSST